MRRHLSTKARARLFLAHDGCCHVCGGRIGPGVAWEVEHVIPLALGGADDESNMAPAHKKGCHEAKTRSQDVPAIARAKRREARHWGFKAKSRNPMPCGRNSPYRKTISGAVVRREQ